MKKEWSYSAHGCAWSKTARHPGQKAMHGEMNDLIGLREGFAWQLKHGSIFASQLVATQVLCSSAESFRTIHMLDFLSCAATRSRVILATWFWLQWGLCPYLRSLKQHVLLASVNTNLIVDCNQDLSNEWATWAHVWASFFAGSFNGALEACGTMWVKFSRHHGMLYNNDTRDISRWRKDLNFWRLFQPSDGGTAIERSWCSRRAVVVVVVLVLVLVLVLVPVLVLVLVLVVVLVVLVAAAASCWM